jgi:hypothetical protein
VQLFAVHAFTRILPAQYPSFNSTAPIHSPTGMSPHTHNYNYTGRYGEVAFKKQLYQSMLGQALFLKTEIEAWRSQNVFGTTIWMYNEIWPTGGYDTLLLTEFSVRRCYGITRLLV